MFATAYFLIAATLIVLLMAGIVADLFCHFLPPKKDKSNYPLRTAVVRSDRL